MKIAVYPGTFDPITNGHTDLIKRAMTLFDKVILAVAENTRKQPLFPLQRRVDLAAAVLKAHKEIEVRSFNTLLVDFARMHHANVILRGLRAVSDFEMEFQLANMNRRMAPDIETLFLIPSEQYTYLSSSLVKEMAALNADIASYVHPLVEQTLKERFSGQPVQQIT